MNWEHLNLLARSISESGYPHNKQSTSVSSKSNLVRGLGLCLLLCFNRIVLSLWIVPLVISVRTGERCEWISLAVEEASFSPSASDTRKLSQSHWLTPVWLCSCLKQLSSHCTSLFCWKGGILSTFVCCHETHRKHFYLFHHLSLLLASKTNSSLEKKWLMIV